MMAERILIVEDEAIPALDLEEALTEAGFVVTGVAASTPEALVLAESNPPDLALLDIHLKGSIDGVNLAEALHERWVVAHVFLTADTKPETLARANRTDPLGYIVKPYEDDELLSGIEIALCRHRQRCRALSDMRAPFVVDQRLPVLQAAPGACPMEPQCSAQLDARFVATY